MKPFTAALFAFFTFTGANSASTHSRSSAVDTPALAHAMADWWNGFGDGHLLFADSATWIDEVNMPGKPVHGLAGLQGMRDIYRGAFADLLFHHDELVAGPLNSKGEFLSSFKATATQTAALNGIKPILHNLSKEYHIVLRVSVKDGLIISVLTMHGSFLLDEIGVLNHMMVDTQKVADRFMDFWNFQHDDLSSMVTEDVKFIDRVNMRAVNANGTVEGIEGIRMLRHMWKDVFPDMHFPGKAQTTPLVGDKFIMTFIFSGTHDGNWQGIPPTHVHIDSHPIAAIVTMRAGKMSQCRILHGKLLITELGLFPPKHHHSV